MGSLIFGLSHPLTDASMEIGDLFFGLFKCGFDLFLCKSHQKVIYQFDITLEEFINGLITGFDVDAQQVALGILIYRSVDERLVQEYKGNT